MPDKIEYKVVETTVVYELENEVQSLLDTGGWILQGGVAVGAYAPGMFFYYQALYRKVK